MEKTFSVSQVNAYIRTVFSQDMLLSRITVQGEVTGCKYHPSGHLYFALKDAQAQINCVMFAGARRNGLNFRLRDGAKVEVYGSVSVYEKGGTYQLYAVSIREDGIGSLYEQFEKRKEQLRMEGLFDASHKKPLPAYPKRIGIVTAESGAALQDICNILHRRNPYVQPILCPAKVQGEGAAETIVQAIRRLEREQVDLMIVGRGGGAYEDLQPFNEESVARAVYACSIPIISGVGHETDTTIIDFVADLRAPTPSAAAELAVQESAVLDHLLADWHMRLTEAVADKLQERRTEAGQYEKRLLLLSPQRQLTLKRQQLKQFEKRLMAGHPRRCLMKRRETAERLQTELEKAFAADLKQRRNRISLLAARLQSASPLNKITKGYGFITDETGRPVGSVQQAPVGSSLQIYLQDGELQAAVTRQIPNKKSWGERNHGSETE